MVAKKHAAFTGGITYDPEGENRIICPEGRDPVDFGLMRAGFTNRAAVAEALGAEVCQLIGEAHADPNRVREIVAKAKEDAKAELD